MMMDVRVICAIGRRGQLGLNGGLPWEGDRGEEFRADVARFWQLTRGHVLLMGPRTRRCVPALAYEQRTTRESRSSMAPPEMLAHFPPRVIFIGGGPPVWAAYAAYVRHWDITRLPYDGEADRWFDPSWIV